MITNHSNLRIEIHPEKQVSHQLITKAAINPEQLLKMQFKNAQFYTEHLKLLNIVLVKQTHLFNSY